MPANALAGWHFYPHKVAGEVRAVAAVQGTEIHFAVAPGWRRRLMLRQAARSFLAPLIAYRGYLTTRAMAGEHADFLTRLGFTLTRTDGAVDYYMLAALPFGKEH